MNLDKFKLLKESDSHFHISAPNGKSFEVEKDKLSDKAQEIIKKMEKMSEDGKYAEGGEIEEDEKGDEPTVEAAKARKEKVGKDAGEKILKSYTERGGNLKGRDSRQQLLEPEKMAEGGMTSLLLGGDMTPTSPQTPQQMASMPLPAGQSTMAQSDKAVEQGLKGDEESVEPSAIGPEDIAMLGASAGARQAAGAIGKEILGSEAGEVGARAASNLYGMAENHIQDALKSIDMSKLPLTHQGYLEGLADAARESAHEFITSNAGKATTALDEGSALAKTRAIQGIKNLRMAAARYNNMANTGAISIPKMADGGEVEDTLNMPDPGMSEQPQRFKDVVANQETAANTMGTSIAPVSAEDNMTSPADLQRLQEVPAQQSNITPEIPINNSSPTTQMSPGYEDFYKQQKAAQQQQLIASQELAKSQISGNNTLIGQLAELPSASQIQQNYAKSDKALMDSLQNNKIDPNRVWNNMSTGNHVLAGIGMLLSGIGSGRTGGQNLAIKMIDDTIDKDVEAQKNDQSNKYNMWKMNRERMGSDIAATLATKNQLITAAQFQAQNAVSKFNSASAQANFSQLQAAAEQQKAQNRFIIGALNPTSESTGGADPLSEQAFLNHQKQLQMGASISPILGQQYKQNQANYAPGIGIGKKPISDADLTSMMRLKNMKNISDQLYLMQIKHKGGQWLGEDKARADALTSQWQALAPQAFVGTQRFNKDQAEKFAGAKSAASVDPLGSNAAIFKQAGELAQSELGGLMSKSSMVPFSEKPMPTTMVSNGITYDKQGNNWIPRK